MQFCLLDTLVTIISAITWFLIRSSYNWTLSDVDKTKRLICILRTPVIHNSLVTYGGTGGGVGGVIGVNWEIVAGRRCVCHEVDLHVTATPAGTAGREVDRRRGQFTERATDCRTRLTSESSWCVVVSNWRRSCCKAARAGWRSFNAAVGATMSAAGRRLKLIIACRPGTLQGAAWRAAAGTGCYVMRCQRGEMPADRCWACDNSSSRDEQIIRSPR